MVRSEGITKVLAALHKAKAKFAPVVKDKANTHLKSKYADLAGYLDAITPALSECGLVLIQPTALAEAGMVVETTVLHVESGEFIGSTYPVMPSKNDPQALGAATTYARRFGLASLLGLAAEDDDGNTAAARHEPPVRQAATAPNGHDAQPVRPVDAWLDKAAAQLGINRWQLVNHLAKRHATLRKTDVPTTNGGKVAVIAKAFGDPDGREWLRTECGEYALELANREPGSDDQ